MSFFAALNTVGELTGWMAQCLRPFATGFEQAGVVSRCRRAFANGIERSEE